MSKAALNPLRGFHVDRELVRFIGNELQRPECILAGARTGRCGRPMRARRRWSANFPGRYATPHHPEARCLHFDLASSAKQSLLSGTLPNGLAFAENGDILISNFGTDRLERMTRDGDVSPLLTSIDGRPLGKVNFVLRDRQNRVWVSISTMINPWSHAISACIADGYIVLVDGDRARIVAEDFHFTNEMRFDAREEFLYVAETTAKRVTRLRVTPDGSLVDREVYGPSNLGAGLIDGIAFDAYGNLWATMIFADRLLAITPEGDVLSLLEDGDAGATARFEAGFATGKAVDFDTLMACGGPLCPWLASITFGGPNLTTVYLGGLRATRIPYFTSPSPGLPMVHWSHP